MPEPFPLCWPPDVPRTSRPQKGRFKVSQLGRCRDELIQEFEQAGATSLILSTNLRPKLNGLFAADAVLDKPDAGVAVYWTHPRKGKLVVACDRWNTVAANLWSIKLTMECLRAIGRYGTQEMVDAAMSGFAGALPHLTPAAPWWVVLQFNEHQATAATPAEVDARARELLKRYHPDSAQGGDAARFALITEARAAARRQFEPEGAAS